LTANKDKIRILLTVPHFSSTASPYREMMALARYLPKEDFELTICSLRNNGFDETAPLLEELGCRVFIARFRPRGRRFRHWRALLKDQKLIAQYGPFDIQHSLDFTSSPVEAFLSKIHSPAFIFTQRNLGQRAYKAGIWLKIRLAKKIIANSDATMQFLASLGTDPGKLEKISLGIDQDPANPAEHLAETHPRYILMVGHVQPLKRQQDAINTLARLTPEIPDLGLLIAGEVYDPIYHQELQQLVESLGLEHRVHFLGVRDDVPALMKGSSALLLCSESEAFPWVVLEAMSVGLPVVATDSGGTGEIVTDGLTGFLVQVGDIDGYAHGLRRIILDPEWAALLEKNAYDLVSTKYSVAAMVVQHMEMYKSLVLKTPTS
jgi:glycosyltransferase involved in cell wall biosynthesis